MFPENAGDEGFGSDDEEYIPDYEVGVNEDVASLKGPSSKRRCMSDFLAKQQQQVEPRKQHQKVDQQHQSLPYHKAIVLVISFGMIVNFLINVDVTVIEIMHLRYPNFGIGKTVGCSLEVKVGKKENYVCFDADIYTLIMMMVSIADSVNTEGSFDIVTVSCQGKCEHLGVKNDIKGYVKGSLQEKVAMMANNDLEPNTQNQFYDEGAANSIEHGVDFPLFSSFLYHQQQQKVQQNNVQQYQEKKMLTKYCAPGSMSSCRALRLKQMQRMTPKKKKGQGPTKLPHVHACKMNERPVMILNSHGQPIGPTKKLVSEYSLFLGTLARNPEFLPLNYCDWHNIPYHDNDKVLEYVQVSVTSNLTFCFMYTLGIIATN
ncbi:Phosphomethylpyrimidine synthase [Bienertia sinuspersici]